MDKTTRVVAIDRDAPDPSILDDAGAVLRGGGLVVFPTETVYGLGADATNAEAVASIFAAKGRPAGNPLIVHGETTDAVRTAVTDWPAAAERLAGQFWPGPLTMVLPRSRLVADAVSAGHDTVGVRVPDHTVARHLIRAAGRLVAAPSANRSARLSPTSAAHVLKDLDGRVDLILDAGPTCVGVESTVVDLTCDPPRILRPGSITAGQLSEALGLAVAIPVLSGDAAGGAFTSPGQLSVHYAPRTPLRLIAPGQADPNGRVGLIVVGGGPSETDSPFAARVRWQTPQEAEAELYATLHLWDELTLDRIDVILPPEEDRWRAVRDRLWRASRPWSREGVSRTGDGTRTAD